MTSLAIAAADAPPKQAEFPPPGSAERIDGELLAVDFIHRTGRFRATDGVVHDFAMPPYGIVRRFGTDADLRDVPLGATCRFFLLKDANGDRTRLALLQDQSSDVSEKQATETLRRSHTAFLKDRGLAGYVNKTEGRTLTITLFGGDRTEFAELWSKEFAKDRDVNVCVANDELRTWNPPVDHEHGKIIEVQRDEVEGYGNSGIRLRVTVNFMLEGFRRGRVVRVFAGPWPLKDQPNGEQLFHYGNRAHPADLGEQPPKEYPGQFPFRTDVSNQHLPWYKLQRGVVPPRFAEHVITGELESIDAAQRRGRFLSDRTGTPVDFRLTPEGEVRYLNVVADLAAIPLGTHCRFSLFQDEDGAFTRASLVRDEASELLVNEAVWRVIALHLDKDKQTGTFDAARQPPGVRNDRDEPETPPDVGRARWCVGKEARVWKGDKQVSLGDLAVGDLLLINTTGERTGHPAICTDVWVGVETHKLILERQNKKVPTMSK